MGINEITLLSEEIEKYARHTRRWILLKLHSSLSIQEQERVFDIAPEGIRKCVLTTNIAETSVTIDGVRFIVDSGKVKEMGYDVSSRMMRLQEYWISRASAEQRRGRAGRTGPGQCFRLFSQNEYGHLNEFSVPEILRMPIESIVLHIKALGLGEPRQFEFIEQPSLGDVQIAVTYLQQHQVLNPEEKLTKLGYLLAQLPVDVVVGKLLFLGTVYGVVEPMTTIAAALSVQSPFVRITDPNSESLTHRRTLFSDEGDPFTFLQIYEAWLEVKAEGKESSRKWCRRHGLEEQRLYEILKLKQQFEEILRDNRLIETETSLTHKQPAVRSLHALMRGQAQLRDGLRLSARTMHSAGSALSLGGSEIVTELSSPGRSLRPILNLVRAICSVARS